MTILNTQEKEHIRESFKRIAPNAEQIVALFYSNLFEAAPSVQPLFDTVQIRQQQAKMLNTLITAVALLDDMDTLDKEMRELGQRHLAYGVTDRQYDIVGEALIKTLRENPIAPLRDEEAVAWHKLYNILADAARSEIQNS